MEQLQEKKRSKNNVFISNSALDVLVEKCDSFVAILILYVCTPILKSLFTNREQPCISAGLWVSKS